MSDSRPHRFAARSEVGRRAQLANLDRGTGRPPSHGTRSARVMAPLRAEAEVWARARWPHLDDTRISLGSFLLAARVQRVEQWTVENDVLVGRPGRRTAAHPIVSEADRWASRLEGLIDKYDAEGREREVKRTPLDSSLRVRCRREGDGCGVD